MDQETARPPDTNPPPGQINMPAEAGRVRLRIDVPPGTCLEVDIEVHSTEGRLLGQRSIRIGESSVLEDTLESSLNSGVSLPRRVRAGLQDAGSQDTHVLDAIKAGMRGFARPSLLTTVLSSWLLWAAVGIYALTRLIGLDSFPIYFFTDEAVQTVRASELLRDHFFGAGKEFLPTYFENGSQLNLSASVYLQVLPYYFFGKSIWVTRGAAALVTLLAAVCVGLTLKNVFKSPYPWLATLILTITPAWFLHSRTAFETALATSFYAAFLYCYLMYRVNHPRYLYGAIAAAALMFYSYTPARVTIGLATLLLLLSDWKYHWQNRVIVLRGLLLTVALALPFLRFLANHPQASEWQMRLLNSYWTQNRPLSEKISLYFLEYLRGLDPFYWYMTNTRDLARHIMPGYGHLLRQTLPFGLLGIGIALFKIRTPAYRALLIAVLVVPSGAALVGIGITRVLAMVVPMVILTALGVNAILEWLHNRRHISRALLGGLVFALLSIASLMMLRDALVNGPLWFNNYGLAGMQYGAKPLFSEIKAHLKEHPQDHLIVSSAWANGTDVVARFFFGDLPPFEMGIAAGYYNEARPITPDMLFVMIPEEFDQLPKERFASIQVEKTLPYPNGQPGFYFVRLEYIGNIEQVLAEEKAARRKPVSEVITLDGQPVAVDHTQLDMGDVKTLFDGNPGSLARSFGINPMELGLTFPSPRAISGVTLRVGGVATRIKAQAIIEGQTEPVTQQIELPEVSEPRDALLAFNETLQITRLVIEIQNINDAADGHVHLWEVTFNP